MCDLRFGAQALGISVFFNLLLLGAYYGAPPRLRICDSGI